MSIDDIVRAITDNFFSQVPILIGVIALLGLLLQRKPVEDVIAGALRATIGVVILNIGIDIFVGGLVAFQAIVSSAVGLEPPTAASTLNDFLAGAGSAVPLIIAGGFVVHIILVAIFPAARYVYLTGHLMYWMSIVIAASLVEAFGDVDRWTLAGVGSIIIGVYWTLQPLWVEPLMRKVMGNDAVGLAHTSSSSNVIAGYSARALKLGDPVKHNAENLRLPKALSFFKDINVSTAFVIGIIMLLAMAFADGGVVETQMAGSALAPWVWGLMQALRFAAGIAILLYGVRMFLAEIVPAFKGLSDRLLKGSKPALDVPITFPKAPTSVMIGFLSATVVFLILMGIFAAAGLFVLVPPMIMLFFVGGPAGIFGNATGGWRGAVFGGVLVGLILGFGQWIGWGMYANTAPELATLADPDWYAIGWLVLWIGKAVSGFGAAGVWVVAGVALVIGIIILVLLRRRTATAVAEQPVPAPVGAAAQPEDEVDAAPTAEGTTPTAAESTTMAESAKPDQPDADRKD